MKFFQLFPKRRHGRSGPVCWYGRGPSTDTSRLPVSQDQRNTARARVRFQATRRFWASLEGEYGSGLPADTGDAAPAFLLAQHGPQILNEVNLSRGRVKPNFALDAGAGFEIYRKQGAQCSTSDSGSQFD